MTKCVYYSQDTDDKGNSNEICSKFVTELEALAKLLLNWLSEF